MNSKNKKFVLNFVPTGIIPTKEMNPNIPIYAEEIIEQILEVSYMGVNMVHLHARDKNTGNPTYKKEVYAEIIEGIRCKNKDIIICVSTSGRIFPEFEKRADVLDLKGDLKPDFASVTLSSLNFKNHVCINSPEMIQALLNKINKNGIRPELEIFDLGMINYTEYLINKSLIKPPYYFNLILGNISSSQADLLSLAAMIEKLPDNSIWSVGGIGKSQILANTLGLVAGDGVRVGLEDNIWYDEEKTIFASNLDLVKRVLSIAKALGRNPYSQKETRKLLGV